MGKQFTYTTQREVRNAFWQTAHDGQFAKMDVTRQPDYRLCR